MTTYRNLHGKAVKTVTTNPTDDAAEGQIWFNSTDNTFKSAVVAEAWASSGPLILPNYGAGGAGTQTAMINFGGDKYPSPAKTNATLEYNGTGWSTGGDYTGTVSYVSGCGTLTAGLGAGGFTGTATLTASAEYDGSSWTSGNSMTNARMNTGSTMVGIQTAALITGGDQYPSTPRSISACEEYDGTNWTDGGAYPVVIQNTAQAGTQTAGWAAGGQSDPAPGVSNIFRDATNHYDGSSWSAGGTLPAVNFRAGAAGTQTAGLLFGGGSSGTNYADATFAYDGSTWTAKPSLATARQSLAAGGVSSPSTAAIAVGGYASGDVTLSSTEEFTASAQLITAGAWSSGGNLNTARSGLGGFGESHSTAVAFAGRDTPIYQVTEEYNGSTWTSVNNYPQTVVNVGATGTLTAGLGLGGLNPGSIPSFPTTGRVTAHYDGTDWTAGGTYVYDAWGTGMAGTQTAAIASGGHNYPMPPGNRNNSAEYNGSAWTSGNTMSQVRAIFATGGSQTASFACGGRSSPGVEDPTNATEEYDGTNWTSGGNYLVSVKENTGAGGPQTAGYNAGGSAPSSTAITGSYDGTAWSTAPSLPAAQNTSGSTTNNTSPAGAMIFGGGEDKDGTYEFTAESTSLNVKTLTQSS